MSEIQADSSFQALSGGFAEDGSFVIVLRGNDAAAALRPIGYCIRHAGGQTDGTATPEPGEGKDWRLVVPLEPGMAPVRAITLEDGVALPDDLAGFLAAIFPPDDAAFERMFARKFQRYGDRLTQFFTARQIARHFEGKHAYRCAAAVVMAYKAAEIGLPALCDEALTELTTCMAGLELCDITNHPRKNREHLAVSMLCAKWHLELALERLPEFMLTLEMAASHADGLTNYFTPAYPISCSMLVLATICALQGDHDRVEMLARAGFAMFQRAVADARFDNIKMFQELEVSHRNVMAMIRLSKGAPRPTLPEIERAVQGAVRMPGEKRQNFCRRIMEFGQTGQ